MNLIQRGRRLRNSEALRRLVRETYLHREDLIYPLFIVEGNNIKREISSIPGQYHLSLDFLEKEIKEIADLGILAVLLFGIPEHKDEKGSSAYDENGIVQKAIQIIKEKYPEMIVITDVCLCQYTSHGHCGVLKGNRIENDASVELIAKIALSHAKAGADVIAPSDMMDGRIRRIREVLDEANYEDISILSYSVKYASAFYGPFREAAHSTPQFGDRKTYQMDFANKKEALKEAKWDIEEGADMVMVKPAMAYQDILYILKENVDVPVVAYNVSGEYSMIKLAASHNLIHEKEVVLEMLIGLKRSGADMIITYFAKDVARWLKER